MIPKPQKIVSKKIRRSAMGQSCTMRIPGVCSRDNATVSFCHVDSKFKGTGNKSPDLFGFYGCQNCHDWYDGRRFQSFRACNKHIEALRAMQETQMILLEKGLININ